MSTLEPNAAKIFLDAVENCDPDRRSEFVNDACGANPQLRARVFELLGALEKPNSLLDGGGAIATLELAPLEKPGTQIGPYKLLEQIGEGGFGVVFLAEQATPIRRRVALKIVKPGMDTRQVIARFEAERQALALMDHPGIAKVFDAGVTEQGRSYFVMELVQGVPITEYCDQCNLPTRERLSLFIAVCQAVQHAHQKGIIHRDLKPTNVLVAMQDGRPVPKIIDFGVAKAIEQRLSEHTLTTAYAQMVGTPLYMSPEQAELSPLGVDTRTDIYSLGVLLYELLTGATPFDKDRLHAASYDELRRIIREEEPPRPSARLSQIARPSRPGSSPCVSPAETAGLYDTTTIAERRRTDPRRLFQSIRGDLDWIVMQCLEKDRNRRYDSAGSLARDVERYLHDEPVQACPPSASYRFKKYIRRHKVVVAFITLLAASAAGLAASNIALKRERDAKAAALAQATSESARAQAVSDYLLQMIFSPSYGWRIKGSQYTVREMLDDYAAGLGNQLADQPDVEAQLRHAIGCSYLMLGAPERAEPHFKRAIELRWAIAQPQAVSVAESLHFFGATLFLQRRFDEAEPPLREALEIYHQLGIRGTMPISACRYLQLTLASAHRHEEAERVIDEAWAEMQSYDELPPESAQSPHSDVASTCAGFAYYFATVGRKKEAAEFVRRATHAQERLRQPIDSFAALALIATTRLRLGDQAGYREACTNLSVPLPQSANTASPYIFYDEFNLARIWTCCLGPKAVNDPNSLVKQAEEFADDNSLDAPYIDLNLLGAAHYRAGNFERAELCFEQSIAVHPTDLPTQHGTVLWPQLFLAMTKWQQGAHDDARRLLCAMQPAIDKYLETPSLLWQYRQITDVLRREAEALIGPQGADEALKRKQAMSVPEL